MLYQFSVDGKGVIGYADQVIYVKFDENGNSSRCNQDDAEMVIFNGEKYNFPAYMLKNNNTPYDPEAPVIYIVRRDNAQITFEKGKIIEKTTDDLGNLESMTCEMEVTNGERFSNIEEMLCELDLSINS